MKKLILLLALAFVMCGCSKQPTRIYTNDKDIIYYVEKATYIIDSCEYILGPSGSGYTHKGNCKYCQKRLENTIDSIIKNNK